MSAVTTEIFPALWRGLVIGFVLAAPVGPIGILCIRRAIARGRWAGFTAGLGAATADIFYGLVAAFGITVIIETLQEHRSAIELVGGSLLTLLGLVIIRTPASLDRDGQAADRGGLATYFSSFAIAIANPATVVAFLGVFASFGPALRAMGRAAPPVLVGGVFLGSAGWWLFLSYLASLFGRRLTAGGLRALNVAAGCLLLALGLWQFFQFLRRA